MLLKVATLILVLLITFSQSMTGLFSATIMFLLAVISAGIAFGTYESLNNALLGKYIGDYGHAAALVGIFLIVLIVTRLLADALIKKNLEFPGIIDRLGAILFGFGSAMILTGVLAIGVQLLPFDAEILGYNRLVRVDARSGEPIEGGGSSDPYSVRYEARSSLWPSPDGFTVRVVSMLSAHSFSSKTSFSDLHPDFLEELQLVRSSPQKESRRTVPPDVLRVKAVWPLENDDQLEGGRAAQRAPEDHWLCVRAQIDSPKEVVDSDGSQRFSLMQVRLVGWDAGPKKGHPNQHTPVGVALRVMEDTPVGDHRVLAQDRPLMVPQGEGDRQVDFVFEVPKSFAPWFLAYKRGGQAEISERMVRAGAPQPKIVEAVTEDGPPPVPTSGTEELVAGRHFHSGQSGFDRKLPVDFESDWLRPAGGELDLSGNRFRQGHATADWPLYEAEPSVAVSNFLVPPGMQLFQLSVTRDEARSIFGRALRFARETVAQYRVLDEQGNYYFRIGEIRIASIGGQQKVEIQYWPQTEMPERCIHSPRLIQDTNLTGDYTLIYLFLIPEGKTAANFHTGDRIRKLE